MFTKQHFSILHATQSSKNISFSFTKYKLLYLKREKNTELRTKYLPNTANVLYFVTWFHYQNIHWNEFTCTFKPISSYHITLNKCTFPVSNSKFLVSSASHITVIPITVIDKELELVIDKEIM